MSNPKPSASNPNPAAKPQVNTLENKRIFTPKVFAWALWDWGSAAFNAVTITFVFSVFLTTKDLFAPGDQATTALSQGMTVAGLIIALLAPISGQKADHKGRGTVMLGIFSGLVVLSMLGMQFVYPQSPLGKTNAMWLGITMIGLGSIFFEFGSVNYNAMLGRVASPKNMGRISGIGWGAGYIGGIVLLAILYIGFIAPDVGWFSVSAENNFSNIRVAMLFATLWLAVFSVPVLVALPGRGRDAQGHKRVFDMAGRTKIKKKSSEQHGIVGSYRELWHTVKELALHSPEVFRFMIASAIFRDGLAGVFTYGAILATTVFGMSSSEVLIFGIAANIVAGLATVAFGAIEDQIGPKLVMLISLWSMVGCGTIIFFLHNQGKTIYWIFGLLLCLFVGPTQSASRSYLARAIPAGREGEIFGLYATTGRAVSFLSPAMFACSMWIGHATVVPASQSAQHWGILGIVVILLAGVLLLLPVSSRPGPK